MRKLKNGRGSGKDEVMRERIKGEDDMVVDWVSSQCMTFESAVVPED